MPSGTPVAAVHGGTVVKAGGNGAGDGVAYAVNPLAFLRARGVAVRAGR